MMARKAGKRRGKPASRPSDFERKPARPLLRIGQRYRERQPLVWVLIALAAGMVLDRVCFSAEVPEWWTFGDAVLGALLAGAALGALLWVGSWLNVRAARGGEASGGLLFGKSDALAVWLFGLLALFGGAYHHVFWNAYSEWDVARLTESGAVLVCLEARVVRPPHYGFPSEEMFHAEGEDLVTTTLELRAQRVWGEGEWRPVTGRVAARVQGQLTQTHVGDTIRVTGRLRPPGEAMNPGEFSPQDYYRARRVLALLSVPNPGNIHLERRPAVWGVWRTVEFLRDAAQVRIERSLRPEEQGVATALFLGSRAEVGSVEIQNMLETGTLHLMAISGLHVGLLGTGFIVMLRALRVPKATSMFVVIGLVFLYVMVTGARPPAVRAGVIVAVSVVGGVLSRQKSNVNTLAVAGIIVLLGNPTALFATGTQMSFLAVGTLIYTPLWRFHQRDGGGSQEARAALSWEFLLVPEAPRGRILAQLARNALLGCLNLLYSSFWMMIVLLPLVSSRFHVMAWVGIVLNLLVAVPMMLAMMSGAFVILLGWIPGLGDVSAWLCSTALRLMNDLIALGAQAPGHCTWTRGTPMLWNVLLYVLVIALALFPRLRFRRKRHYVLVGLALLIALVVGDRAARPRRDVLRCSFIAVSHGLSVLVELPDGRNFLFDAGQFSPARVPVQTISGFLWTRGVGRLDAVFLSHPDMDHYNALPGLLRRFDVGEIYVSPAMWERLRATETARFMAPVGTVPDAPATSGPPASPSGSASTTSTYFQQFYAMRREREAPREDHLGQLYRAIRESRTPLRTLSAGDRIPLCEGIFLEVLHPRASGPASGDRSSAALSTNSQSLVLALQDGDVRILLTGDLAPPGLMEVLEYYPEPTTVVQSPHHGGRTCNTPQFARWARAEYCVICESFALPQTQTTETFRAAGAQVFHTGRDGAVIFEFRDGATTVLTRETDWRRTDER